MDRRLTAVVDQGDVDDKLSDLHGGKVFLPPDLLSTSSCEVVIVCAAGQGTATYT
jgi:hypothetical protein